MEEYCDRAMQLSAEIIELLEQDYKDLKSSLDGDIYDEYKALILKEIDLADSVRNTLKHILS